MTHDNWKNYAFKMQTQDESEAQILTGHTVVAVDLWVALQIISLRYKLHQITKYIMYILEFFCDMDTKKPWFKKWNIR